MQRLWLGLGCAFLLVLWSACGSPSIDASSDESLERSLAAVRDDLDAEKEAEFEDALEVLVFSEIDLEDMLADGVAGSHRAEARIREVLDGKTADQVIAEAREVLEARYERERAQALDEIDELEEKRARAEAAREELERFEVLRSRFTMQDDGFLGPEPIIEITVRNGTGQAISRAYFEGTLASPERSVPWHQGTFNYSIPGGLEPGEEATWRLSPGMFSDWAYMDPPPDAILTVTVEQLDDADGEPLYSARSFTERDAERLADLKERWE